MTYKPQQLTDFKIGDSVSFEVLIGFYVAGVVQSVDIAESMINIIDSDGCEYDIDYRVRDVVLESKFYKDAT